MRFGTHEFFMKKCIIKKDSKSFSHQVLMKTTIPKIVITILMPKRIVHEYFILLPIIDNKIKYL